MDKEQITFDGIPIPLTMETLLDAYNHSWIDYDWWEEPRRHRQMTAFRARILRQFEQYEIYHGFYMGDVMMIETITEKDDVIEHLRIALNDCDIEITAKDARIAELEAELEETAGELINTDAKLRDEKYPRS